MQLLKVKDKWISEDEIENLRGRYSLLYIHFLILLGVTILLIVFNVALIYYGVVTCLN